MGFYCSAEPSVCRSVCGDLIRASDEECDLESPGCSNCTVTEGWTCDLSQCREICHDGLLVGRETCDAGDKEGCLEDCSGVAEGFVCSGKDPTLCQLQANIASAN